MRRRRSAAIFRTAADYRDPYLKKLIAEKGGNHGIWPPIRYFVLDPQSRSADAGAVETDLDAHRSRMQNPSVERKGLQSCSDLEYNWLGTDDQGRDVWRA